jgi:hypothetical protein
MSIEKSGPNFNYDQTGLNITVHDIRPSSEGEPRLVTVRDIPRANPQHESYGRVLTAVESARNEGGIGFTLISPEGGAATSSKELTAYQYPWSGHTNNPVGINEMAALSAALPTHTILAIDNPATGSSDRLPRATAREIARTGSYLPYAEIAVTALEKLLKDFEKHNFTGGSQGARRSIACAAFMGMSLNKLTTGLRLIDPVGSHEQSMLELAKGFMIDMAGNSGRYVEASSDALAAKAQKNLDSPGRVAAGMWDLIKRHGVADQFWHQPRALAKDGLRADLEKASPYVTDALVVTSPELSELTHPEDVQRILEEIAELDGGPQRIEHRVVAGQTHALFAGHPGTLGVLLSDKFAA